MNTPKQKNYPQHNAEKQIWSFFLAAERKKEKLVSVGQNRSKLFIHLCLLLDL